MPGVLYAKTNGEWLPISMAGPKGPKGDKGDKGDTGVGEPGPEGGTPVVALAYDNWPPVDPQPDTLYLRLAP